jgi:hypothetical protein
LRQGRIAFRHPCAAVEKEEGIFMRSLELAGAAAAPSARAASAAPGGSDAVKQS